MGKISSMMSKRCCFLIFCLCMIGSLGAFNHDYSQTLSVVWRSDRGMIAYSETGGEEVADVPFHWGNTSKAKMYRITSDGLVYEKVVTVRKGCLKIKMDQDTPYYIVPETGTTKGR